MATKLAASACLAADMQFGIVPVENVFDDRQPQTNAAVRACASTINTEKPFGQPGNILLVNPLTGIADNDIRAVRPERHESFTVPSAGVCRSAFDSRLLITDSISRLSPRSCARDSQSISIEAMPLLS